MLSTVVFLVLVALKVLVACSAVIVIDTQIDKQSDITLTAHPF